MTKGKKKKLFEAIKQKLLSQIKEDNSYCGICFLIKCNVQELGYSQIDWISAQEILYKHEPRGSIGDTWWFPKDKAGALKRLEIVNKILNES